MSEIQTAHSAPQSAAGYLYQARVALVEVLRYVYADPGVEIALEKFDDVSFEKDGIALDLLQTKHHIKKVGDLSDSSVDLWKTLRIWADTTKSDPSVPRRTRFVLITTAKAPEKSAASYLRPANTNGRNPAMAESLLVSAANISKNKVLTEATASFTALTPEMRKTLVAAIEIVDSALPIADMEPLIEKRLRMIAPRGQLAHARELLEGWWWPRICRALQSKTPGAIPILEVEQKLDDIRDRFRRDALPLDMEHVDPPQGELDKLDEMLFVLQLLSIGIGGNRLQFAKRDFYRASVQRSQWVRDHLLFDGEIGRFDRSLIEEWQPRYEQMCNQISKECEENVIREAGNKLYGWVETEARFPLRDTESRFLNVGSYHILSDDLRVGWRPNYNAIFESSNNGISDDK